MSLTDNEALNEIVQQNKKIIALLQHIGDYDKNKAKIDAAAALP